MELIPWFADPPDELHSRAAGLIEQMWNGAPELGDSVAQLAWVSDGINVEEAETIAALADVANSDPSFALQMLTLAWVSDGVTAREVDQLTSLASGFVDPGTGKVVLGYPWVMDGLTERERSTIDFLMYVSGVDRTLAVKVAGFPWIDDGVFRDEAEMISELESIIRRDTELARLVVAYPWMAQEVGYDASQVLYGLARIAESHIGLARRVASLPWVADVEVPTFHQWGPLDDINIVASRDLGLARHVTDIVSSRFGRLERRALARMRTLVQEHPEAFEHIKGQPWYLDGLDGSDLAFLATTRDIIENSPGDFYEMVDSRYTKSKSVDLPLAGKVNIWAIQKTPFPEGDNIVEDIEHAIRSLEELTSVPFPSADVVVLVVVVGPDSQYVEPRSNFAIPWPGSGYGSSHVRTSRYLDGPYPQRTLFHELAHYYFDFVPAWVLEGGAEFATSYIWHRQESGSFAEWGSEVDQSAGPGCPNEAQNLHELGSPGFGYRIGDHTSCFYTMGEHLFSSLFFSLGAEVMASSLKDIIETNKGFDGRVVTSKDVYLAFRNNIGPDQEELFQDLFARLHGGPLTGNYSDVSDDHGDDESTATPVAIGETLQGSLEHPFDTDYFKLVLEGGKKYSIALNHNLYEEWFGPDLHVRLHPPDGRRPMRLGYLQGGPTGIHANLQPEGTGEYYVTVESTVGITGAYDLLVTYTPSGLDDHGDDPATATTVSVDVPIAGTIDPASDVDYFKVQVTRGSEYKVEVVPSTLDFSAVTVYEADGVAHVELVESSEGIHGAYMSWIASKSGFNYLVVESPLGRSGSYTLKFTEVAPGDEDHG